VLDQQGTETSGVDQDYAGRDARSESDCIRTEPARGDEDAADCAGAVQRAQRVSPKMSSPMTLASQISEDNPSYSTVAAYGQRLRQGRSSASLSASNRALHRRRLLAVQCWFILPTLPAARIPG